jgi:hypothetical protein
MTTIEDNIPHEVSEVICLKCLHRWIAVYPTSTLLKDLECKCGAVGYVIKTGQTVEQETKTQCDTCKICVNGKCKLGLSNNPEIYCEFYKEK